MGDDWNVSSVNTIQIPIKENWYVFGLVSLRTIKPN